MRNLKQYVKSIGNKNFVLDLVQDLDGNYIIVVEHRDRLSYHTQIGPNQEEALEVYEHTLSNLEFFYEAV